MASITNTIRQLAVLGGRPTFHGDAVPLIRTQGYRPQGDFSAVDAILVKAPNEDSMSRASRQRFVSKILPDVESPGPSFRVSLQRRIGDFLQLDPNKTSVICMSSGTTALRAVLKSVRAD